MTILYCVALLILGLLVLVVAGELLVRGAARFARSLGISALVVGLTIVAFGTSAPEVAVSIIAAIRGEDEIAIGNVVGSNIANILLILGLSAAITPLRVALNLARIDAPLMAVVSALFLIAAWTNGEITRLEGVLFCGGLLAYTTLTYALARREPETVGQEYEAAIGKPSGGLLMVVMMVFGIIGLAGGAHLMVVGASGLAEMMGVSKRVIGLTIVAVGTSLPELATCISAGRHGQHDIAVGNVVGSNLFNILSVIGISATIQPLTVARGFLHLDGPVMLTVALVALPVLWSGHVRRWQGVAVFAAYGLYLAWTISQAKTA